MYRHSLLGQKDLNQGKCTSQKTLICRVDLSACGVLNDGNLTAGIDRVLQDDNYE